ncbi:sugar phosphate isomerase/epimerase [Burkholderia thailandensis]|uniref:sugar phosphate isomerase/epimerase family protein n=1 Tax=Burkholderia thailandensis TaxID=57975 RepID=UPI00037B815B|nr:TIM barrel protein [Burkholderia thailandensis]AHI67681.1 xylose isomerase-like TIM barrel family protein [Burkholderia thailandensis H0587]AOJ53945.1 hypothetical protein AQ475_24415 [Burkholderia thailandensis]AVR27914.1 hypothetical protein A8H32_23355 [Burkholderia thailandensis]MCS3393116.1 sugar phosphate isomerase/epimerase [Burkholderia thailandensis]MCS6429037.1 sugar phosphate isomerase/epimerase [Burkholderia thailandensis]
MPQYGIAGWCIDTGGDAVGAAARHGLSALHLGVDTGEDVAALRSQASRDALRARCLGTGVRVSCLALNLAERIAICGARADEQIRMEFLEIVASALGWAAEVGVPLVYIPSFGLSEMTSGDAIRETAELLAEAADLACLFGIDVASENSLGAADTVRLVEWVGRENFRILFDIYNPRRWGHSPLSIIAAGGEVFAEQIHVKDGWLPHYGNAPLTEGDGDVTSIVRELMRRGLVGTFVLENDYMRSPGLNVQGDLETLCTICNS